MGHGTLSLIQAHRLTLTHREGTVSGSGQPTCTRNRSILGDQSAPFTLRRQPIPANTRYSTNIPRRSPQGSAWGGAEGVARRDLSSLLPSNWLWLEGAPCLLAAASRAGRAGKQLAETRGVAGAVSNIFLESATAWHPPVPDRKESSRPSGVERDRAGSSGVQRGRAGPSEAERFLELSPVEGREMADPESRWSQSGR